MRLKCVWDRPQVGIICRPALLNEIGFLSFIPQIKIINSSRVELIKMLFPHYGSKEYKKL